MADESEPTTLVGPNGDEVTVTSPAAVVRMRYAEGYSLKTEDKPEAKPTATPAATPRPGPTAVQQSPSTLPRQEG